MALQSVDTLVELLQGTFAGLRRVLEAVVQAGMAEEVR